MGKLCVLGAGTIGGELAAHLAQAGATISVVARDTLLSGIRACGIAVRTRDGTVLRYPPSRERRSPRPEAKDAVIVTVTSRKRHPRPVTSPPRATGFRDHPLENTLDDAAP